MKKPKFKFKFNFTTQMLLATVLGIIAGLIFKEKVASVKFIGDLFLRLVQMCVVPLIMGQIIEAVARLIPKILDVLAVKLLLFLLYRHCWLLCLASSSRLSLSQVFG